MITGGLSGATHGGVEGAVLGAAVGGLLGGTSAAVIDAFGKTGAYGLLLAGATTSYNQHGVDGLAYFAGGFAGGVLGAVWASDFTQPGNNPGQAVKDDPLRFDGKMLYAEGPDGEYIDSWPAKSGRPSSTFSLEDQGRRFYGPIPEGSYRVDPTQIQKWSDLSFMQKVLAYVGRGQWPGGTVSWGHQRVPIQIIEMPPGIVRSNMFIHGGRYFGSAGCIDLGPFDHYFFNYFSGQSTMSLTVNYP